MTDFTNSALFEFCATQLQRSHNVVNILETPGGSYRKFLEFGDDVDDGFWNYFAILLREKIPALQKEYESFMSDTTFDWVAFAKSANMVSPEIFMEPIPELENEVVIYYLRYVLHPVLYPSYRYKKLKNELLRRTVFYILMDIYLHVGVVWVSIDLLIEMIRSRDPVEWDLLQAFHFESAFMPQDMMRSEYNVIKMQRKRRGNYFFLNEISHFSFSPTVNRALLTLFPESVIDYYGFTEQEMKLGFDLRKFKWTKKDTEFLLDFYHQKMNIYGRG